MITTSRLSAGLLVILLSVGSGCSSRPPFSTLYGGPIALTLVNDTSTRACFIHVRPSSVDGWGTDWLGPEEIVEPRQSRAFQIAGGQTWDIQIAGCDHSVISQRVGVSINGSVTLPVSTLTGTAVAAAVAVAPTAPPRAIARRFCEGTPPNAPGRVSFCEDFSTTSTGELPHGWVGGAGLGVRTTPDGPALVPLEPTGYWTVSIPTWRFGGDFRITWLLRSAYSLTDYAYMLRAGAIETGANYVALNGGFFHINESAERIPESLQNANASSQHTFVLVRHGSVYRLLFDAREVVVSRLDPPSSVEGLAFEFRQRRDAENPFALIGLSVEASNESAVGPSPASFSSRATGDLDGAR